MNDAFNWWMLIVGLVVGAGLVWLVLADGRRTDADVAARERASEARWIAETLRAAGHPVDTDDTLDVLRLHEAYLAAAPPDEIDEDEDELIAGDAGRDLAAEAASWPGPRAIDAPAGPAATEPGGTMPAPALRVGRGAVAARTPMAHPISGDAMDGSAPDR